MRFLVAVFMCIAAYPVNTFAATLDSNVVAPTIGKIRLGQNWTQTAAYLREVQFPTRQIQRTNLLEPISDTELVTQRFEFPVNYLIRKSFGERTTINELYADRFGGRATDLGVALLRNGRQIVVPISEISIDGHNYSLLPTETEPMVRYSSIKVWNCTSTSQLSRFTPEDPAETDGDDWTEATELSPEWKNLTLSYHGETLYAWELEVSANLDQIWSIIDGYNDTYGRFRSITSWEGIDSLAIDAIHWESSSYSIDLVLDTEVYEVLSDRDSVRRTPSFGPFPVWIRATMPEYEKKVAKLKETVLDEVLFHIHDTVVEEAGGFDK